MTFYDGRIAGNEPAADRRMTYFYNGRQFDTAAEALEASVYDYAICRRGKPHHFTETEIHAAFAAVAERLRKEIEP